jgi:uncharacterized protein YndB with AHSA1/START domain
MIVDELLVRQIALACPVDHAFAVFTDKIDLWWPRSHRRNRDASLTLTREALMEHAPDGSEWMMARVTEIDPPRRLSLDWYPGSPAAPTSVEIDFVADGDGTVATVTHRPLPETKSIWPQRVATFASGWDAVLPALKRHIEET